MPSRFYTPSTRHHLLLCYRPGGGKQSTTVRISIVSAYSTSADIIASSPGSRMSPALTSPIHFRTSGVDACDHSECFLFSCDLHRLYHEQDRRPRILINPQVRVAYEKTWYHWNNVFLRRPIIRWWLGEYSRGFPKLMRQEYRVMISVTSYSIGRLNDLEGGATIVLGMGSINRLTVADVRLSRGQRKGRGMSEDLDQTIFMGHSGVAMCMLYQIYRLRDDLQSWLDRKTQCFPKMAGCQSKVTVLCQSPFLSSCHMKRDHYCLSTFPSLEIWHCE